MENSVLKTIIDLVEKNCSNRKIVFYNPEHFSLRPSDFIIKDYEMIVLDDFELLKESIKTNGKLYYYLLWCNYSIQIEQLMQSAGTREVTDYLFRNPKPITLQIDSGYYSDNRGNQIFNSTINVKYLLRGYNNTINLNKGFYNNLFIEACNCSSICFGLNVVFGEGAKIRTDDNSKLKIGNSSNFQQNAFISVGVKGSIVIGSNCTFGSDNSFAANYINRLIIGDDILTARRVLFQCGDGHSIFNVLTRKKSILHAILYMRLRPYHWTRSTI